MQITLWGKTGYNCSKINLELYACWAAALSQAAVLSRAHVIEKQS